MKLFGYELLKLGKKRTLWLVALILFAVSAYLFFDANAKDQYLVENRSFYEQQEAYLKSLPEEERLPYLEATDAEMYVRSSLLTAAESPEMAEMWLDNAKVMYPELFDRLVNEKETLSREEIAQINGINAELLSQARDIASYEEFLDAIDQNVVVMLKSTIFGTPGTFPYNNILQTQKDFAHMRGISLDYGLSEGVIAATDFFPGDLFLMMLIFLMCVYLYNWEWERGLYPLVKSGKNGRLAVILAKLATLLTGTVIVAAVFYGAFLLGGGLFYGYGDLSRPIQSMQEFRDCNLLMSVGQYLAASFGIKLLALILVGLILSALFLWLKNAASVYAAVIAVFGISWALNAFVSPSFQLNHVRYINLFALIDARHLLGEYTNLNFFSQPVNLLKLWMVLLPVLLIGLAVYCCVKFTTERQVARHSRIAALFERVSVLWRKRDKSARLFPQEGFKILIQGKVVLVLLIAGYLAVNTVVSYFAPYFPQREATYRSYLVTLAGENDEERRAFIEREQAQFDEIPVQMQEIQDKFDRGEIDAFQKYSEEQMIAMTIGAKQEGYEMVLRDQRHLDRLAERGIEGGFVDQITAEEWFDVPERELQSTLLFLILCIICLGNVFSMDSRRGVIRLLRCTKEGQGRLMRVKFLWSFLIVLVLYLACFVPNFYNMSVYFGVPTMSVPLQSVQLYGQADGSLSIGGFLILTEVLRFLGLVAAAALVLAFSSATKNFFLTVLLSGVSLASPILLQMLGVDVRSFTISSSAMLYNTYTHPGGAVIYAVYGAIVLLFAAGCVVWIRYTFTGKGIRGGSK